jgi:hypothetical protein
MNELESLPFSKRFPLLSRRRKTKRKKKKKRGCPMAPEKSLMLTTIVC